MPSRNSIVIRNDFDLMLLLPGYFKAILDFQELMGTEEIELNLFWTYLQRVWNNLFIQTADEDTIKYHEELLGIISDPDETLELRRWKLLNRYRSRSPFTLPKLYEMLNEGLGIGNWNVVIDYPGHLLRVNMNTPDSYYYRDVIKNVILAVPAHLATSFLQTTNPTSIANIITGGTVITTKHYTFRY